MPKDDAWLCLQWTPPPNERGPCSETKQGCNNCPCILTPLFGPLPPPPPWVVWLEPQQKPSTLRGQGLRPHFGRNRGCWPERSDGPRHGRCVSPAFDRWRWRRSARHQTRRGRNGRPRGRSQSRRRPRSKMSLHKRSLPTSPSPAPTPPSGVSPEVLLASSLTGNGHDDVWSQLHTLVDQWKASGWWEAQRRSQRLEAMERHARELLLEAHLNAKASLWQSLKDAVENQSLNAYSAQGAVGCLENPTTKNQPRDDRRFWDLRCSHRRLLARI